MRDDDATKVARNEAQAASFAAVYGQPSTLRVLSRYGGMVIVLTREGARCVPTRVLDAAMLASLRSTP